MRSGFERDCKFVDGEGRAYGARTIHRYGQLRTVRRRATFRIARPVDEVVMFGGNRDKREVCTVHHPSSIRRDDGTILRL